MEHKDEISIQSEPGEKTPLLEDNQLTEFCSNYKLVASYVASQFYLMTTILLCFLGKKNGMQPVNKTVYKLENKTPNDR